MTQSTGSRREIEAPMTVTQYRTEPQPDGSIVLTLLSPDAEPYVMNLDRFALDKYVAYSLLCALRGIPDPGPRPEIAALMAAQDSGDRAAFEAALDDVNARIHRLWSTPAA